MNDKKSLHIVIPNLLTLQAVFGAGSAKAYRYYRTLEDKGLLTSSITEILKTDIISSADKDKFKSCKGIYTKILIECKLHGIWILPITDKRFPDRLRNIPVPPLVLYIKGKLPNVDEEPLFCIVGPRKVSGFGERAAYSLGYRLAKAGMTVVSGGALGADYYAHLGALKSGGKTIAILGCGIANGYLPQNRKLRDAIAKNCCLISEYPPSAPASKRTFPVRNRLLSGLSLGVLVVEAGERSGALITAKHACEQGRDVFVIPGNPTYKQYKGSNKLLRDGAYPLIDANDVFDMYLPSFSEKIDVLKAYEPRNEKKSKKNIKKSCETLSKEAKIVYNYLDKPKFIADDLLPLGLSYDELLSALTELEVEHFIKALPGGMYELIS